MERATRRRGTDEQSGTGEGGHRGGRRVTGGDRLIHSARLVDGGTVVDDAWVRFSGGTIAAVGSGPSWRSEPAVATTDAAGAWLTAGFVDIHVHGGGGASFDDGADAIVRVQYQCMSGHVTEVMCYGSAVRLAPTSSKAA